jgi:hypothetical protein
MPIEDLNLSVRAYNCLKRAGITKVGQILEMSEDDLLGVRNFGHKSLDELRERLAEKELLEHSRLGEESTSRGEYEGAEEFEEPTEAADEVEDEEGDEYEDEDDEYGDEDDEYDDEDEEE